MAQDGILAQRSMGFLGVNLHTDRLAMDDQEMASAINADFHTQPGTVMLRAGRQPQFLTPLILTAIRRLAKISIRRYQVSLSTLFRNQSSIAIDLHGGTATTFVAFQPLNETVTWMFIGDGASMRKDDGNVLRKWGIDAPTTATAPVLAIGAAGSLIGDYNVVYTYVRKVGGVIAHESNPSPQSNTVTLASNVGSISGIADSADPQVTHKRIYRTLADSDGLWLFDQEIAQGVTTATTSQPDSTLGSSVEFDNDPPPTAPWIAEFQSSMFFLVSNKLYWSKRYLPESVPAANFVEIGSPDSPLLCAAVSGGLMGVFNRDTKYRIAGDSLNGFIPFEALSKRGTPCINAVVSGEFGIIFPALDGIFVTNLSDADQVLSQLIDPIFYGDAVGEFMPIDWALAHQFASAVYKKRYYFSYAEQGAHAPNRMAVYSQETRHWYFYDHPVGSLYVENDTDLLTAGGLDGLVYVLENGATDYLSNIAFHAETKDFSGGNPFVRKLYFYARIDIDTMGDYVSVQIIVDGVAVRTLSINSSRRRSLIKLPDGTMGSVWRMRITYIGRARIRIYGVEMHALLLDVAA